MRLLGGGQKRALLDLRDAGEHAHHGAAAEVGDAAARLADEVFEHPARALEVGDDAVHERGDERHVARLPAQHVARIAPDGDHLAGNLADGDHRRLVHDDAAPAHRDDDRGRADVNRH